MLVAPDYDYLRLTSFNNLDSGLTNLMCETRATDDIGRAHTTFPEVPRCSPPGGEDLLLLSFYTHSDQVLGNLRSSRSGVVSHETNYLTSTAKAK